MTEKDLENNLLRVRGWNRILNKSCWEMVEKIKRLCQNWAFPLCIFSFCFLPDFNIKAFLQSKCCVGIYQIWIVRDIFIMLNHMRRAFLAWWPQYSQIYYPCWSKIYNIIGRHKLSFAKATTRLQSFPRCLNFPPAWSFWSTSRSSMKKIRLLIIFLYTFGKAGSKTFVNFRDVR